MIDHRELGFALDLRGELTAQFDLALGATGHLAPDPLVDVALANHCGSRWSITVSSWPVE